MCAAAPPPRGGTPNVGATGPDGRRAAMFHFVRLAGVSAALAAGLVLATEPRAPGHARLGPALEISVVEVAAMSRNDTRGDIALK